MKFTTFILLALVSFGLNAAGKSAYINSKVLLEQSPQAIAANSKLKEQFGEREKSLRDLAKTIQEMEQTYKNDSAIMSAEQKKKAEDNIIQNKRRFQFEQQSLKEDLQAKQRELLQELQVSIRTVIRTYGKEQGYDFIFTDSSIAYASDAMDITDEILEELKK
ncbi:MAG: OmpH family outer membrane protein [Gammaproteobacteria bacterium]|nr:MAG: OmpH family outer membrane protein [Gammaproteobacteria bacterium]